MTIIQQALSLTPLRTTRKSGEQLAHPIYVNVNVEASQELLKLRLQDGQAAIYGIAYSPIKNFSEIVVVGETGQTKPLQRILGGYQDRVQTMKQDNARTITGIQLKCIAENRKSLTLYACLLDVCAFEHRRVLEKEYIMALRQLGNPLLNAT
jgi:hypothetical protein